MKTRKVGKIVSLLVAIVLVATIMIPAASVLAAQDGYDATSGVNWDGNNVKVVSVAKDEKNPGEAAYYQLRDYLRSAEPNKPIYIRIDADVDLPNFDSYSTTNSEFSKKTSTEGKYYIEATYGIYKDSYQKTKDSWGNEITHNAKKKDLNGFLTLGGNPYSSVFKTAAAGDHSQAFLNHNAQGDDASSNKNYGRYEELDTKEKQLYAGITSTLGASYDIDPSTLVEYDDVVLTVNEGTEVVINLNGYNISGQNTFKDDKGKGTPFTGSPRYLFSIFNIKGDLTVVDEDSNTHKKVDGVNTVGMITGGSGSLYGKPQINQGDNYTLSYPIGSKQGVAYWQITDDGVWHGPYAGVYGHDKYLDPEHKDWGKFPLTNLSWSHSAGNYRVYSNYVTRAYSAIKEVHGGGVYVAPGANFTLLSGKISENGAWRLTSDKSDANIFDSKASPLACGGGVYVDEGATFTMKGGEISDNAVRTYNKKSDGSDATARGGGVYLASKAKMYMYGGKIVENAVYAEVVAASNTKSARAYGGGIYVSENAECNIIGEDVEEGATTIELAKTFPSVSNNSCGAVGRKTSKTEQDVTVEGGGIYNSGTLNLKNAMISANDFAEGDIDLPSNDSSINLEYATHVMRDDADTSNGKPGTDTGLALYIKSYDTSETRDPITGKTVRTQTPTKYVTRLDPEFDETLELATEKVKHETSGIYGTMHGNEESAIFSNGAGVCLNEKGTIVVGERVWVVDNYDLVTTGHKAFASVRDYRRTWEQEKQITDDRVVKTNDDGYGVSYTDPAGGYVYDGTYVAPVEYVQNSTQYTSHVMDGYAFSDTTDDLYLPEGKVIYKGDSLFETKIGVNYWDMVNADGTATEAERGKGQAGSRAGNRVLLVDGTVLADKLDRKIWTGDNMTPVQSDIQFFYLNDNNKNWERYKGYSKNENDLWYNYDKNAYNYALPGYIEKGPMGYQLCDLNATNSSDFEDRVRVRVIDTDNSGINKDASPYEGYINYNVTYPVKRWADGQKADPLTGYDEHKNGGYWRYYQKETYRISDPTWSPDNTKEFRPKNGAFSNAIVNFPQRAYPVTAQMKKDLPSSYLKAKYMDYKVVYDDNQFGTSTEPVIRLGTYSDPASNDTIRKMFVTVNFDEADIHFYGQSKDSIVYNSGSAATNAKTDTFVNNNLPFANVNAEAMFYGTNKVKGTIDIAKIVPDYASYGKGDILEGLRAAASANAESSLSYDDADKKNESIDLYFKGWKYYTSYGDGPKVATLSNSDDKIPIEGTSLSYRGYFPVNLENIFNPNINSQPCPSLTAIWYTKEELAAARQNLSACKAQLILGTDGHIYIRVISVLGAYGKDRNNLQPIQASDANSSLSSLYYNAPTFVASKLNATPTLEGGYKATVNKGNIAAGENFSARVVKKIICNDDEKNTFTIDIYDYISGNVSNEKDIWVKFINSNPVYKNANNSKSNTYVSFMWTNIDTGLTLAQISNADGSDYSDAAKEVWFVTPCIELTTDQAGYEHDSYYYGASRGFSIASLDAGDLNKLLKQAKAMN